MAKAVRIIRFMDSANTDQLGQYRRDSANTTRPVTLTSSSASFTHIYNDVFIFLKDFS